MKAYFTASIYQREKRLAEYKAIIAGLKKLGVAKIFSEDTVSIPLEEALNSKEIERKKWFNTWRAYVSKSDFAIAEISFPSTINIGFEVNKIIEHGKPVICLYKEGSDPAFISELHSKRIIKSSYTIETLPEVLAWAVGEVRELINRRFTFILSPDIDNFLDDSFENYGLTASDLIRDLIRKEMGSLHKKKK